jgi:uncharacterized protein (TIGR02145 family)
MKKVVYFILVSLLVFTSCKKESNPTSPTEDASTVTYSGKVYHTVKIGTQTWLKENLDVGVMIQGTANASNNGTTEKYCYNNDTANCTKYGGLYQWDEAMAYDTENGAKGICPTGWHIPTKAEFDTLAAAVGNIGNSLKAIGQGELGLGGAGTDSSGFSALLAGYRYYYGGFYSLKGNTNFWSSTMYDATFASNMFLWNSGSGILMYNYYKVGGYSIRCLKNN